MQEFVLDFYVPFNIKLERDLISINLIIFIFLKELNRLEIIETLHDGQQTSFDHILILVHAKSVNNGVMEKHISRLAPRFFKKMLLETKRRRFGAWLTLKLMILE